MLRSRGAGLGFSLGGCHTDIAAAVHGSFDAEALVATPAHLFLLDHVPLTRGLPLMLVRRRRFTRLGHDWLVPPRPAPLRAGRRAQGAGLGPARPPHAEYMLARNPEPLLRPLLAFLNARL